MHLLLLGGTAFLGRAIARHARDAGHEVTCVARGASGEPVDGVRFVAADRDDPDGLSGLDGESFDAAVDVTRVPRHARHAVAALAGRVDHWCLVSSISVYADHATVGQRADQTPLLPPSGNDDPPGDGPDDYGRCKVSCEQIVNEGAGPDRSLICRAGLIVGPEDRSGRFTYWVSRLARGGRVLAPGAPDDPVQLVDVRDLAGWLVTAAGQRLAGTFDATGMQMSRQECLTGMGAALGTDPEFTWVDPEFLAAHEVRPWAGDRSLPLWVPLPDYAGLLTRDTAPARAAGLHTRPLSDTTVATRDWLAGVADPPGGAGLTPDEEADLLRRWDERSAPVSSPGA